MASNFGGAESRTALACLVHLELAVKYPSKPSYLYHPAFRSPWVSGTDTQQLKWLALGRMTVWRYIVRPQRVSSLPMTGVAIS